MPDGRTDASGRAGPRRIMLLGATGTIGRATAAALIEDGHEVVCLIRADARGTRRGLPDGATLRFGDATDATELARVGFAGERFDVVVSCLASRTGEPQDAWRVDYAAHVAALRIAQGAGVSQMVLLSAICVQRPMLAFQHAKLAFEQALIASGLDYSIVRPTAFFKSLSGQVERVRQGRPYLMFGDGRLTACKPISDRDLARYLTDCVGNPDRMNGILPIGGPGPAITPLEMGEELFRLLGRAPTFRRVPVRLMDGIIGGLRLAGHLSPRLRQKAGLAEIGRYYATQSMLVIDEATGHYSAESTPTTGRDTLFKHYARLIDGTATTDLGDHAMFSRRVA